jgi:hypothetical protein
MGAEMNDYLNNNGHAIFTVDIRNMPAEGELQKSDNIHSLKAGLSKFSEYPAHESYRIFVDGRFHKDQQGFVGYEMREPGCIKAIYDALSYALSLSNLREKLGVNFIKEIHKRLTSDVDIPKENNLTAPGKFRVSKGNGFDRASYRINAYKDLIDKDDIETIVYDSRQRLIGMPLIGHIKYGKILYVKILVFLILATGVSYGCYLLIKSPSQISTPGITLVSVCMFFIVLLVIIAYFKPSKRKFVALENTDEVSSSLNQGRPIYLSTCTAEKIQELVENTISDYNEHIGNANTDDEKIMVIVSTIRRFMLIHPFPDANGRVFANVLLVSLLVRNGFVPPTYYDPNIFNFCRPDKLVLLTKEAMALSEKIINGQTVTFEFNSESIPITDKKHLQEWSNPLYIQLNTYAQLPLGKTNNNNHCAHTL